MIRRLLLPLAIAITTAGCWDFLEPDFPEAGAPAVFQTSVFINETGTVQFSGLLLPGLTPGGLRRTVANDTAYIYGLAVAPKEVRKNGSIDYSFTGLVGGTNVISRPFEMVVPTIQDVGTPPPVRWFGIRKIGTDTFTIARNTDLILRVDTTQGPSTPPPQFRQWFLDLAGGTRAFRLSSDGLPPATLRVPAEWVPVTAGTVFVTLTFYQSGQQQSPIRDYISNLTTITVLRWTIRVI